MDFRDYAVEVSNNTTLTDCSKLVHLIHKAGQVWSGADVISGLTNGLTEIGNRFGSASDPNYRVGVLRSDPHFERSFGSSGFNGNYNGGRFIDPSNQVRHFVGWLAAGFYHDQGLTSIFVDVRERLYSSEGTNSINNPDVALGLAAIDLGRGFQNADKLAQEVWNKVCGESSTLKW